MNNALTIQSVLDLLIIFVLLGCQQEVTDAPEPDTKSTTESTIQMQPLTPEETGIDFNNTLVDNGMLNVFVWNFLYSGAGVAAGDVNNDGLPDLFFAGNQVSDRLYLNKGDFVFEDITEQAGIDGSLWSTGVTMADVNADGLLDIYVCKNSASVRADLNTNKLFINQGDLKFQERAAGLGLADQGFSTQATFFDLDNDWDLDMYLVNQPIDQFAQYVNPQQEVQSYPQTDRLFRNDGGRYVDITAEQGLVNSRYGLSVSLADFDGNGWTDLYICNDYEHGDHLYMNDGGTLTDQLLERTGHTSFYSMGSDVADINNDGALDCIVLDMAFEDYYRSKTNMESMDPERFWSLVDQGHHHQYAVNTLQLNRGDAVFVDIAHMAGVPKSDWSWTPLFVDLDNDGWQDLAVTNGIMRDMKNNDFSEYVAQRYAGQVGPANFQDVLSVLPSVPVANKLYRNTGDLHFDDISSAAGFSFEGFSHGMAYADFDNDGLLDLAVNNMNAPASIYRNTTSGAGNYLKVGLQSPGDGGTQTVTVYWDGRKQTGRLQHTRGYFSASEPVLHFGLGASTTIDSVVIDWNERERSVLRDVAANQLLTVSYENVSRSAQIRPVLHSDQSNLAFTHAEQQFDDYADQVLLPYQLSQNGPALSRADINGDGLTDLYVGGAAGQAGALFIQQPGGGFSQQASDVISQNVQYEDVGSVFLDYDGDGDQDLYVVSGSNEFREGDARLVDRMYRNQGNGDFIRDYQALPTDLRINGKSVSPGDFDGDGDIDLFVGGRVISGQYPLPAKSAVLLNDNGRFTQMSQEDCPCLAALGMVTASTVNDFDKDGDEDIMVVGEWMQPMLLDNEGGRFSCISVDVAGTGLWWSVEQGDFDADGDVDFVLGNLGWNNKFGGAESKLEVYAGDFDQNGDHDVVLAKRSGPQILPVRGRECSSEEMPFVLDKFPSFDAFGKADLFDLLSEEQRASAWHASIETFSSIYLQNQGDGNFTAHDLPTLCQTGPIRDIAVADLNDDGHLDFVYAGNHYPTEVETARYDGLVHGICYGNGAGSFESKALPALNGDYRALELLRMSPGYLLVAARNNDRLQTIQIIP